jgi:F-type H+-transporting ATPase subunit b
VGAHEVRAPAADPGDADRTRGEDAGRPRRSRAGRRCRDVHSGRLRVGPGARTEANAVIDAARGEADEYKAARQAEADAEIAELRRQAQAEIAEARREALAQLRGEVSGLAVMAASAVVQSDIDADAAQSAIDRALEER